MILKINNLLPCTLFIHGLHYLSKNVELNRTLFLELYMFLYTPQVGFEPTTNRLTVGRSTAELLRLLDDLAHYTITIRRTQVY